MLPSREKAQEILSEAVTHNPGPWEKHSYLTAECAEKIAGACKDMNTEKAYILGLLHDIGRRFGVSQMRHIYDGWRYMKELGYEEAAKICLTHSCCIKEKGLDDYIGKKDITDEQKAELERALEGTGYDDYDLLIQLSDCLAGGERLMYMEDRIQDTKERYGNFPQDKRDRFFEIKLYFEEKTGCNIYEVIGLYNDKN